MTDGIYNSQIKPKKEHLKGKKLAQKNKVEQDGTIFATNGKKIMSLEKASTFLNEMSGLKNRKSKDYSVSEKNALNTFYDINGDGTTTDEEKAKRLKEYKDNPIKTFKKLEQHYKENFSAFDDAMKAFNAKSQVSYRQNQTQTILNRNNIAAFDPGFSAWLQKQYPNATKIQSNTFNPLSNFNPRSANIPGSSISTSAIYQRNLKLVNKANIALNGPQQPYHEIFAKEIQTFENHYSKYKARYDKIADKTGVPSELIASLHWREGRGRFDTYLHNGQKLGKKTTKVPAGVDFNNWDDAAVDALKRKSKYIKSLGLTKDSKDIAAMATFAEVYNGTGYAKKGMASPYVYSGTDQYYQGKYTSDGPNGFDAYAIDKQLGVLPMLHSILDVNKNS